MAFSDNRARKPRVVNSNPSKIRNLDALRFGGRADSRNGRGWLLARLLPAAPIRVAAMMPARPFSNDSRVERKRKPTSHVGGGAKGWSVVALIDSAEMVLLATVMLAICFTGGVRYCSC